MSTHLDAIPYIIEICPCGLFNLVENVTKLGVSVRKILAVNLFNLKLLYKLDGQIHVDAISEVYLHKPQRKYGYGFTTSTSHIFSGCRLC